MNSVEKTKYSQEELKEFEAIILEKIEKAKSELTYIKESINKSYNSGNDSSHSNAKTLEDGADTAEKENLNKLAERQMKFLLSLENALVRIKNGTYGICQDSGKLIGKERLKAVPHTTLSIEAKLKRNK